MRKIFLFLWIFLMVPYFSYGEELVSGGYDMEGKKIKLNFQTRSNVPISLIINQYLPPGTAIIYSSPPFKTYQKDSGIAKWIFNAMTQGAYSIDIETDPPSRPIKGEIIYKEPSKNKMRKITVTP